MLLVSGKMRVIVPSAFGPHQGQPQRLPIELRYYPKNSTVLTVGIQHFPAQQNDWLTIPVMDATGRKPARLPVNIMPLLDDTDFKTREIAIVYNAAGMDLVWNFVTTAGAFVQTAVTPTTAGNYDWTHQ